jgi:hypothetical protein
LASLLCQKVCFTLLLSFCANRSQAATEEHAKDLKFRKFHRQLFHSSVAKIVENLRPGMTTPEVVHFGDGHYQRVIYGLGPYIADYEEQVLLACIVRNWCPRYVPKLSPTSLYLTATRCMSHPDSLDTKSLCRRCDHTEMLVEEATYGALWMEYGIVGDLVVSLAHLFYWSQDSIFSSRSQTIFHVATFTNLSCQISCIN